METIKEIKQLPERKKTFKIENNTYDVEFPTTGGLIEIEILKTQLSRGQYNEISNAGTVSGNYSRFMIDTISTFTILFPQLKKDLNVKTISELNPLDSKKLLKVYLKEVLPWLNSWMEILNSDDEETPINEK